jgi:glycine cleavage system H protein
LRVSVAEKAMSEIVPHDLRYTQAHAWVRIMKPGTAEVGITDHAQSQLGNLVATDLPAIGSIVTAGSSSATVESTKAASEVESPVSGTVAANNPALEKDPELVNKDPYGKGWLYRVTLSGEPKGLLSADEYLRLLAVP